VRRLVLALVLALSSLALPGVARAGAVHVHALDRTAQSPAPAGLWRLDEGQGTVAADSSGNEHTGTLTGGASWRPGRDRTAGVAGDGAGGYVDVATPVVDTERSFTVMAWARFDTTTGFHTVLGVDGSEVSGFYLEARGDSGRFAFTRITADATGASHVRAEASAGPQPGTWYHLAGVYDAAARQISLYVNGVLQQTVPFTTPWRASGHLTIGRGQWAGAPAEFVDGTIDDVRAYQAALTPADLAGFADRPTLDIDLSARGPALSRDASGLAVEEISHSGDGGLYAELVRNRSLKESDTWPVAWTAVTGGGARGAIALDRSRPLNSAIDRSLRVSLDELGPGGRVGAANAGYWGVAVKPRTTYRAAFHAMTTAGFTGQVAVSLESADGRTLARATVADVASDRWRRHEVTLTTPADVPAGNTARIVVAAEPRCPVTGTASANASATAGSAGTAPICGVLRGEALWLSMVSVFPPTYKGHGLRTDVMEKLAALKPGLLRVPGGHYLEGTTVGSRFSWKQTIGPIWERPGHQNTAWGYWSTDGLGLLEYLRMAEDLGAQPLLALYAGYSLNGSHIPADRLEPYVQDALDEIEYAIGPVTSPWGARRARDGHPEPFPIRYVEVGNEDWFDRSGSYEQRYAMFYDAIKARFPRLKVIASTRVDSRPADVVDDHYYNSASWFTGSAAGRYDGTARGGPRILVGAYGALEGSPTGTVAAGLGEAGFRTGLERNADLVIGSMYAPLLVNENAADWPTNLIGLDGARSYGSPSYHVLRMFADHRGDHVVGSRLAGGDPALRTAVTRAGDTVYVKVVNSSPTAQPLTVELTGAGSVAATGDMTVLSGDPGQRNTLADPERIRPATTTLTGLGRRFEHVFPARSFTILTLTVPR
jgi:alpha-L-arabinofuranosidase-like protein/concanavalin A-like lectin/glucanase superfamily protein